MGKFTCCYLNTLYYRERVKEMAAGVVAALTLAAAPEDDTFLPGFADEENRYSNSANG